MSEIKELYNFLKGMFTPDATVLPGKVTQINAADTIDVAVNGLDYFDVRLKANDDASVKSLKLKPAVGSDVIIGRIGDDNSKEYVVLMYSIIDEYKLEIGNSKLIVNASGFTLQKGSDTLLKALKLVIESIQPITVIYGNEPDFTKLTQALTMIQNILQ